MYSYLENEFLRLGMMTKKFVRLLPKYEDLTMIEQFVMNQIYLMSSQCEYREINVSDVLEQINVTKAALSQILNSLENKNYITRQISTKDRRAVALGLTELGEKVLERYTSQHKRFVNKLVEKMGEEKVRRLLELMNEITEVVDCVMHEEINEMTV